MFDQAAFEIRCEWGMQGVLQLAPISDVIIVVDVLSFSTCLDIANSRGAIVFPYQWQDDAKTYAQSIGAELADKRGNGRYSLSPRSLIAIASGTRLVLPSPNGSTLSLATGNTPTWAGCLRNAKAIAAAAMNDGKYISVILAGERWADHSLRPCFEDLIGAGAILSYLEGNSSPEAQAAIAVFQRLQSNLKSLMKQCSSGQELIDRGFESDVDLASALNVSDCVPTLIDGAYIAQSR
jgi:2-phosphosulfolactate phosphatase